MSLGIKHFLTIQPLSKKFVHVFISLAANKVLIGAKINTHKLILKTASKATRHDKYRKRDFLKFQTKYCERGIRRVNEL